MNKNTSVIMASAIAAILTITVLTVAIPNHAFAGGSSSDNNGKEKQTSIAIGGNGGIGGAGGAGGSGNSADAAGHGNAANNGGQGSGKQTAVGTGVANAKTDANGGRGGDANGGDATIKNLF